MKVQTQIQTEELVKNNQKVYNSIPLLQVSNICRFGDLSRFFPSARLSDHPISKNQLVRVIYTIGSGLNPTPRFDYFTLVATGYYRRLRCIPSKPLTSYRVDLLQEICSGYYAVDMNLVNNVIEAWEKLATYPSDDSQKNIIPGEDLLSMLDTPVNDQTVSCSSVVYQNNDNFFKPLSIEFEPDSNSYPNF